MTDFDTVVYCDRFESFDDWREETIFVFISVDVKYSSITRQKGGRMILQEEAPEDFWCVTKDKGLFLWDTREQCSVKEEKKD